VPDSPIVLLADALRYPAYAKLAGRAIVLLAENEEVPVSVKEIVRYSLAQASLPVLKGNQQITVGDQIYQIASPSRGIATNAALAIVVAQRLGVAEADIRERILAWRPSGNRGQIESVGAQTYYIDCYNANPASMADALEAFIRSTPQDAARLYILGAMDELGATASEQHEAVGNLLQLRLQDRAVFVGSTECTQAYTAGAASEQCICAENIEKIESTVAQFQGAIFLKGSRSHQLEKLLPDSIPNP
jgi:UDP-N-acetylmuramoyl-tripeptide--D-alanyl-D-alanine ligase